MSAQKSNIGRICAKILTYTRLHARCHQHVENQHPPDSLLTGQEADSPEAGVQRGLDVNALVQRHNDPLLQVQPVVGADRHSQQPQAADCKDAAQQCQSLPATRAHGDSRGSLQQSVVKNKRSQRRNLEEEGEKKTGLLVGAREQIHIHIINTHMYPYV